MFFLLINIINQSLNSTPMFVHPFFLLGTNPKALNLFASETPSRTMYARVAATDP